MRRLLITGSRDWTNWDTIRDAMYSVWCLLADRDGQLVVVHGACPTGADALADEIARANHLVIERHPAEWDKFGKRAGYIRNAGMTLIGADICLAFIRNHSRGATMCADLAERAGIRTIRFEAQ